MKGMIKYFGPFIIIFMIAVVHATAQDPAWEKETEGEIEAASFVVEKDRQIELPQEIREFEKIPPLAADKNPVLVEPYSYTSYIPALPVLDIKSRALKIKKDPLEKLYGGWIKAGFGNYMTPLLGLSLYNKREEKYLTGLDFNHLSSRNGPVDKENSGSGETRLKARAKYFGEKVSAGISGGYDHTFVHFYGYPNTATEVQSDSIRRKLNHYGADMYIENTEKTDDFDYKLGIRYDFLKDNYDNSESKAEVTLTTGMYLNDQFTFFLDGYAITGRYLSGPGINRHLIKIKPYIYYRSEEFDVKGGLNFVFQNDTINDRKKVFAYPYVHFEYMFNGFLKMYLQLDGDMETVTLESILEENPYLDSNMPLYHSNKKYGLNWGMNVNAFNHSNFTVGFSYGDYRDYYFFLNDSADVSRFNMVYENGSTTIMNFFGEWAFSSGKDFNVSLRGDYYNYKTAQLVEAWHRPKFKTTFHVSYNIRDKIVFGSDIYLLGGMKAFDFTTGELLNLKNISDVNFNVSYLFSDRFSAFIEFENILGRNYERYYRYPHRGMQILAGISFNF